MSSCFRIYIADYYLNLSLKFHFDRIKNIELIYVFKVYLELSFSLIFNLSYVLCVLFY